MNRFLIWFIALYFAINGKANEPVRDNGNKRNVILDVDASGDDLMAILFLLSRPDIEIKAITTVTGVSKADAGTEMVLRLLHLVGITNIPVAKGATEPLEGRNAFPAAWQPSIDRPFGLTLPPHDLKASGIPAHRLISDLIGKYRGNISILALGPLTNIAMMFKEEPELISGVEEIYVSDGAVNVSGGIHIEYPAINNTVSGWNLWVDAVAGDIVFGAGVNVVLIPLDLTAVHAPKPLLLSSGVAMHKEKQGGILAEKLLALLMGNWIDYYTSSVGLPEARDLAPVWDVVAAAIYVNPDICTEWEQHTVRIMTGNPDIAGRIIITDGTDRNVSICLKGNQAMFDNVLLQ